MQTCGWVTATPVCPFLSACSMNDASAHTCMSEYVARVMALMYAAIRVRFDILFAVNILSQKCQQPTKQNFDELDHLLRYINGSLDKAVILDTTSLDIHVWADASFMLHADRKGQTGVAVTLGINGPCVAPKSSKAKC